MMLVSFEVCSRNDGESVAALLQNRHNDFINDL